MSDNVTQFNEFPEEERRPTSQLLKRIGLMAGIVLAVLLILVLVLFHDSMNLDSVRRWVKYMNVSESGDYGLFAFDAHSNNCYATFDDGLAVASVSGINTYDKNGEERHVVQQQMTLPHLQVQGDLAVAYDVGGKTLLALHSRSGEVLHLEESRPILDVDLSKNGQLCLSSSASGYKSVISVYSNQQKLVYRWLSSTAYLPLCAMSPNGKELAAVSLGQENGVFQSSVLLLRTDSEEIQQSVPLGSELIYDIAFLDEQTLCAIGESTLQVVRTNGEVLGSVSYGDQYLKDFDSNGNGFLTLALNMYRAGNRYSLKTVDYKGRQIAEVYLGQEILDMSACGRYLAVLTPQGLTIYTQSLEIYYETVETGSATSVVMREDGSVLLLGGGRGWLYIP